MTDPLGLVSGVSGPSPIFPGAKGPSAPAGVQGPGFKDVLMENLEQVNRLQEDAAGAIEDLATGRRGDVDGVMIAKQKADVAFQMLVQVRNTLMDAYDEVKQIRV
ncbi:MAG: flagellar hook-basal body complex protein FliE [Algisphaera sp.]